MVEKNKITGWYWKSSASDWEWNFRAWSPISVIVAYEAVCNDLVEESSKGLKEKSPVR